MPAMDYGTYATLLRGINALPGYPVPPMEPENLLRGWSGCGYIPRSALMTRDEL
jgi:hypothetical protein